MAPSTVPSTAPSTGMAACGHDGGSAILALSLGILVGAAITHVCSRYMPGVPYTPTLLLVGVLVATLKRFVLTAEGSPHLYASLDAWEHIDGHLLLRIFLPALLFNDAMQLEWHRTYRCLSQCLVLAVPGVLISAALTACYVRWPSPHEWEQS